MGERFQRDYADSRPIGKDVAGEIARYFALDGQLVSFALEATSAIGDL